MNPGTYRALAVMHALRFYARTGMKVNTAYTPKNMIAAASQITGKKYKRSQLEQAANDIEAKLKVTP